ncbi:hypothetical protein FRC0151_00794 [Corynebacterium diphtheriae]|nr:hypothetical protein FRC0151_00794 [Corynebacterium diphtheriae]
MFYAARFALLDSVNVLLIGVIVAVAIMVSPRGKYRGIVGRLILGDWLGVFVTAIPTLALFHLVKEKVEALLASPVLGIILILTGVFGVVMTLRGGDNSALVNKILVPLKQPGIKTVTTGFMLGAIQSLTSVPFFTGLAYLSVSGFSPLVNYAALFLYASLALSLPTAVAVVMAVVRANPTSPVGKWFTVARANSQRVSTYAAYAVSIILVLIGVLHL